MSDYRIATLSQNEFYFDFYINSTNNKKKWYEIVDENNLWGIINLGYFNLSDFNIASNTKYRRAWIHGPAYQDYGIALDELGRMTVEMNTMDVATMTPTDNLFSYTAGCPPYAFNGKDLADKQKYSKNGSTMIGIKENNDVVFIISDKDEGQSSDDAIQILKDNGCIHIVRMDGSWSSHGRLGPCNIIQPSQYRYDKVYLMIYKRNWSNALRTNKKVTLAPFSTLLQKDETLSDTDVAKEYDYLKLLQKALLNQGIESFIPSYNTVSNMEETIASQTNCLEAKFLLALSIYSNTPMVDIITSAPGTTADRNIVADNIGDYIAGNGYTVSISNHAYKMLSKANPPANLIIFGHTTEDNDKIIIDSIARGITEYFGLEYIPEEVPAPPKTDFELLQEQGIIPTDVKDDQVVLWKDLVSTFKNLGLIK